MVDLNLLKKTKKTNLKKQYVRYNLIEIFNMSHNGYSVYDANYRFQGNDIEDLKNNIDNYLKDLIKKINEPLKYCSCCNGTAVVMDGKIKGV